MHKYYLLYISFFLFEFYSKDGGNIFFTYFKHYFYSTLPPRFDDFLRGRYK